MLPGVSERSKVGKMNEADMISKYFNDLDAAALDQRSLKDYFEQPKELIRSAFDRLAGFYISPSCFDC